MVDYIDQTISVEEIECSFKNISQDSIKVSSILSARYTLSNTYRSYEELDKLFLPLLEQSGDLIPTVCCIVNCSDFPRCDDGKRLPEYKQEIDSILIEYLNKFIPVLATNMTPLIEQLKLHPDYLAEYRTELNNIINSNKPCKTAEKSLRYWQDAIPNALLYDSILLLQLIQLVDKAPFYIKSELLITTKEAILTCK